MNKAASEETSGDGRGPRGVGEDGGRRGLRLRPLPFALRLPPPPFRLRPLPFALCLLPFAFLLGAWAFTPPARREAAAPPAPLGEAEADELLTRAARTALGGREGVVVALDARTGRVRALAGGRAAFEEATPPGSAVKPFTMFAALRAGSLAEGQSRRCRGRYERADFHIDCAHPRHRAPFGPAQALANSCNYYFARTAESLDGDAYARALREFGFGARTGGGDGDRESAGLLPRDAPGVPEMLGESDRLRVTPAQLVSAYAALFNGGLLLAPRVARAEGFAPTLRARVEVAPAARALLLAGMRGAVAYGTASGAGLATLPVYVFGKTGTSTPQHGWRAQGWFVGFAAGATVGRSPGGVFNEEAAAAAPEDVKLAVLVFLKRSRGSEAAAVARPVFEAYARALGVREEAGLAAATSGVPAGGDAEGAGPSGPHGVEGAGPRVRVRLSREDATASLALEDYVFGVLAAEGSVESEPEALKSLAVVARTYAVSNLRRHARDRFDLCDTTHCQRFAAVRDESARPDFYALARRAVRETAGEVLRDRAGRVAESYFSASCGGTTADVAKLWGESRPAEHLRGVRDDACAVEGWTDVIPAAQLSRALAADARSDAGAKVEGVRVVRRDRTGRAELVEVEGARRRLVRGWDFKIIVGRTLGWNVLKSSRFEVARAGSAFVFRGAGFGHGLGLCQAGARVSAARGANHRQILGRYFPGAVVGELRDADFGSRVEESAAAGHYSVIDEGAAVGNHSSLVGNHSVSGETPSAEWGTGRGLFHQAAHGDAAVRPAAYRPAVYAPATLNDSAAPEESWAGGVALSPPRRQSAALARLRSEHFRVTYPARAARGEAEALLRTLEAAYADMARRLERAGLPPSIPDTEVFVHATTGDFVGVTGRPAWVAGVTEGRRIDLQPLDVLRRRGLALTTPRHEFVHAALASLGAGRAPLWLSEGLAAHVAGEGPSLSRAAGVERLSVEELERRLARPASAAEMRALYAAAYREVGALVRREGEPAVWRRAAR
ncbi:MAG TPA: SpoIID/LytB domain-containing protein [Pyrinomonadaceae bacterium]